MIVYEATVNINTSASLIADAGPQSALVKLSNQLKLASFAVVRTRPTVYVGGGIFLNLNPMVIAQASVAIGG